MMSSVTVIDEEFLLQTMRDALLGGKIATVRVRSLTKMYIKRLIKESKPYFVEINSKGISAQIRNYLVNNKFKRISKTPSIWAITRPKLEKLCKKYVIEIYPIGTV